MDWDRGSLNSSADSGQLWPAHESTKIIEFVAKLGCQISAGPLFDKVLKKIRFLQYDLQVFLQAALTAREQKLEEIDELERLSLLRRFFFEEKTFICRPSKNPAVAELLLHEVLSRRSGSPLTVGLLFCALAEQLGMKITFIGIEGSPILKLVIAGRNQFLALAAQAAPLSKQQVLALVCARPLPALSNATLDSLGSLDGAQIIWCYLLALNGAYKAQADDSRRLDVLNFLISHYREGRRLLPERALLRHHIGQAREALTDLKRYFSFFGAQHCSADLVELYRRLQRQQQ